MDLETFDPEKSTPEKLLLKGILFRAVKDLTLRYSEISAGSSRQARERSAAIIRAQAEAYLRSEEHGPFSCRWICDHLGVDHNKVTETVGGYIARATNDN